MTNLILPYVPCTLCINHTTMSPAIKTITAHICLAANPTVFLRKLKAAPTTLPMMAGNSSAAFPARLLSASASLSNHPFLSFGEEPPVPPPPPPKAPSMARTIVAMVIERAASIEDVVITLFTEQCTNFF